MKLLRITIIIIFIISVLACNRDEKTYTIATLEEGTSYRGSGLAISKILKSKNIELKVIDRDDLGPHDNCKMLWNNEIDFAISQNDINPVDFLTDGKTITDSKIRSLMPLYSEMLFIIHHDSINPNSLRDLIVGRKVGLGPENSGTAKFFKLFANHFGIDTNNYEIIHTSWAKNKVSPDIDVSVTLSGFHTIQVNEMMLDGNCKLFGFKDVDLYLKGSSIDGFCMNYKAAHPIIIPKNTFGVKPQKPILTVAIDAVLLCRTDIDEIEVYNIVKEIYEQKNILAKITPILEGISDDYNPNLLSFPLHEGAIRYLHRNEPSFLERYAELMGIIITIIIAFFGALTGLFKLLKQKKKNRVDEFYMALQKVENKINDNYPLDDALKEIESIKEKAVKKLVDEKLAPNESFNIFLNLYNNLYNKIINSKA